VSLERKVAQSARRRALRVRGKFKTIGNTLPRVSVFRSSQHMYAQVIDDQAQRTLVSCSSLEFEVSGDKKTVAKAIGLELAKRALEKKIDAAVFDRGQFLYHGRVKALADGLREGGMRI